MFANVNPGLSRRFPLSSAFVFDDFSQSQLAEILFLKLKQQGFGVTETAEQVALDMLNRARNRPNFGNAGEIDILLNEAKMRHMSRISAGKTKRTSVLEAVDFDEDYDRVQRSSETNVAELFAGTVGCQDVVRTLQGYQDTVRGMLSLGMDPKETIPFTFLFRGPPGTGKSTTARKMGKVFYDMGFLSSANVLDCSASDLIGSYVGQTGPKVQRMLDKALGQVLLVDEAYRLAEGAFAKEALDELVDAITKPKYRKRLIIILAGYVDDMNHLLKVNPGLGSRFPDVIDFRSLDAAECYDLLVSRLSSKEKSLQRQGTGVLDASCLQTPSESFRRDVGNYFDTLSEQSGWASARDVETLAESMFQTAVKSFSLGTGSRTVVITETTVKNELAKMLRERQSRSKASQDASCKPPLEQLDLITAPGPGKSLRRPSLGKSTRPELSQDGVSRPWKELAQEVSSTRQARGDDADEEANDAVAGKLGVRDAGVSDEIWSQLQRDAEAEARRDEEYETKKLRAESTTDEALRESIIGELLEEEERRKKEAEMKKRLETEGRCPVGYAWIRQATGWRCAGGSHFVSEMGL
ncbi:hypothetical protein E4U53_006081 [Claviceps sorghi]|nr:hypothetical protein E4U53_006081 [Claviceps sorghi]